MAGRGADAGDVGIAAPGSGIDGRPGSDGGGRGFSTPGTLGWSVGGTTLRAIWWMVAVGGNSIEA